MRSTLDQALVLHETIDIYRTLKLKAPVMVFLDIKAAYDMVDKALLFEKCREFGISEGSTETIKQLYDFNRASVKVGDKQTSSFSMPSGVQQGSIISPLLYSIFIDGFRDKLQVGKSLKIFTTLISLKMMT